MESTRPLTKLMKEALAVIADARNGEISGLSIATCILRREHGRAGVREALKGLERRNLVTMRRMEQNEFPDRMKAMYSLAAHPYGTFAADRITPIPIGERKPHALPERT